MEKSAGFYIVLATLMLIFGAANTFMFQLQDYGYTLDQDFVHPFMQAFTMFIGEFGCVVLYKIQQKYMKEELL